MYTLPLGANELSATPALQIQKMRCQVWGSTPVIASSERDSWSSSLLFLHKQAQ